MKKLSRFAMLLISSACVPEPRAGTAPYTTGTDYEALRANVRAKYAAKAAESDLVYKKVLTSLPCVETAAYCKDTRTQYLAAAFAAKYEGVDPMAVSDRCRSCEEQPELWERRVIEAYGVVLKRREEAELAALAKREETDRAEMARQVRKTQRHNQDSALIAATFGGAH